MEKSFQFLLSYISLQILRLLWVKDLTIIMRSLWKYLCESYAKDETTEIYDKISSIRQMTMG